MEGEREGEGEGFKEIENLLVKYRMSPLNLLITIL